MMSTEIKKGIILAGGKGSRLYPMTRICTKQLLAVYSTPLIYFPLATLLELGIRDILIITNRDDQGKFKALLGDGSDIGCSISYDAQAEPNGIGAAFIIGADFIGDTHVALILGDNIFCRHGKLKSAIAGYHDFAMVFGIPVANPQEYGIAETDRTGKIVTIKEKPSAPRSDLAIVGLYFYDPSVVDITRSIKPSVRGELEVSDINQKYLERGRLDLVELSSDTGWFDAGTPISMLNAANFLANQERDEGRMTGCIEEVAYRQGYIDRGQLQYLVDKMPDCGYKDRLVYVLNGLG